MKKNGKNYRVKKLLSGVLALIFIVSAISASAFAAEIESVPTAVMSASNSVTFSNLDKIAVNEVVKFEIIDANGDPATVGIERVLLTSRSLSATTSSTDWKVWYTGVSMHIFI